MLAELDCFEIGSPAAYFTGDSHGQSKEACCDAQEASKRGKASAKPARKRAAKRATPKKRSPKTVAKMASRKAPRRGAPVIEDTIIDVIDEPVPGVVRVTEYETIRTTTPKRGGGPETEE